MYDLVLIIMFRSIQFTIPYKTKEEWTIMQKKKTKPTFQYTLKLTLIRSTLTKGDIVFKLNFHHKIYITSDKLFF